MRSAKLGLLLALPLIAATACADPPVASGRAFWCVPTVGAPPMLAELLSGAGWPDASALTGLCNLNSARLSRSQPVFWIGRDSGRMIVAWRVPKLDGRPLCKQTVERDGPLWNDDSIEVFLDPLHTHTDYLQFMVNANGAQTDARARDISWNGEWQTQVAEDAAAWAGVALIPFATLQVDVPAEGTVFAANFGVDRSVDQRPVAGWQQEEQNITWARLGSGTTFHDPGSFGHLTFATDARVQLTDLGAPWRRSLELRGESPAPVNAEARDAAGQVTWSAAEDPGLFSLPAPEVAPGDYTLAFTASADAGPQAFLSAGFRAVGDVDARVETLALSRKLIVQARLEVPSAPAAGRLGARLLSPEGNAVRSGELATVNGACREPLEWDFSDLPAGEYRVALQDPERPQLQTTVSWSLPERPSWLGSDAGKFPDDVVLKPWTALQVGDTDPLTVSCWGRSYSYSGGLIQSVQALDKPLLAAPMAWSGEANGQALSLAPEAMAVTKSAAGAVEFTGSQSGGGVTIRCEACMEFDGFVKLRLTVSGQSADCELDSLALSVPFRAEVARLMHYFPRPSVWVKVDPNRLNARAVPKEGWASPFIYHVWVGDEEKGLQWLCETDENWRPADPERAIELVPEGDRATLKLNLIGRPTKLDRPREYVFAFQASPVKPTPRDYRHWRYAQVGSYGIQSAPHSPKGPDRSVSYPAAGNINPERGTLEITLTPNFDSTAPNELNRGLFDLFWPEDTRVEPERLTAFYWNQDDRGMRVVYREHDDYKCICGSRFAWKPGETHTVAFTWGEDAAIYVDGEKQVALPNRPLFVDPVDLEEAVMRIGGTESDFILHQVRISDNIRPAEQMAAGAEALAADDHTLLLDRFSDISGSGGDRISRPVKIASGGAGRVTRATQQVDGGLDISRPPFKGTVLDYYENTGLRYLGFHEHWTDWQGFPRTLHTEPLRALLAACHEKDLKLLLYHSWQLADIAPEYPLYLRECEIIHPERFIYTRQPPQKDYPVCARSAWADFMADGIEELFTDFGPDGIYSDGLSYPGECMNGLHGCGYVGEDGQRHPTFSLFPVREAMKRFRYILQQQAKDTLFVCHTSGGITLPTLAFSDAYLDGEHMCGLPRPLRVPLDAFRAEFMGHNFGLPAYYLVYDWLAGMTSAEGIALSVLHDTELPWSFEAMAPVWRVWDEFGADDADFQGYWENADWLAEAPEGVEVSAYVKPNGEKLLVVVNTNEEPVEGIVRLKTLVAEARDALEDTAVTVRDGAIEGRFASWRLNLIWVKG